MLAAIRRFNDAALAAAGNGDGPLGGEAAQFALDEIEHVNSSILAIGELRRADPGDSATGHPLVLCWHLGSGGELRELEAFASKSEAVAAIDPPESPLRVSSAGFIR